MPSGLCCLAVERVAATERVQPRLQVLEPVRMDQLSELNHLRFEEGFTTSSDPLPESALDRRMQRVERI